jgi:hypothetical protein
LKAGSFKKNPNESFEECVPCSNLNGETSTTFDEGAPKIYSAKKAKSKVAKPIKLQGQILQKYRQSVSPVPKETDGDIRKKALASLIDGSMSLSTQFTSRYELGDLLGDGAFGFVFTAKRLADGVEVAVKFIIKSKIAKDSWLIVGDEKLPNEVATLQRLSHPNVIQYIEHIIEADYILLITELHGTSWDASNLELDPLNNPGLKFKFREKTGKVFRSRTSCDLFECIDARMIILNAKMLDTRIPTAKAKFLFSQIFLACEYLQSLNLVHRDIKDEV